MPKRYRKLRGDTAYYPFAARTGLRARQRRHARALRIAGAAALILAAVLALRQSVFRGGPARLHPPRLPTRSPRRHRCTGDRPCERSAAGCHAGRTG